MNEKGKKPAATIETLRPFQERATLEDIAQKYQFTREEVSSSHGNSLMNIQIFQWLEDKCSGVEIRAIEKVHKNLVVPAKGEIYTRYLSQKPRSFVVKCFEDIELPMMNFWDGLGFLMSLFLCPPETLQSSKQLSPETLSSSESRSAETSPLMTPSSSKPPGPSNSSPSSKPSSGETSPSKTISSFKPRSGDTSPSSISAPPPTPPTSKPRSGDTSPWKISPLLPTASTSKPPAVDSSPSTSLASKPPSSLNQLPLANASPSKPPSLMSPLGSTTTTSLKPLYQSNLEKVFYIPLLVLYARWISVIAKGASTPPVVSTCFLSCEDSREVNYLMGSSRWIQATKTKNDEKKVPSTLYKKYAKLREEYLRKFWKLPEKSILEQRKQQQHPTPWGACAEDIIDYRMVQHEANLTSIALIPAEWERLEFTAQQFISAAKSGDFLRLLKNPCDNCKWKQDSVNIETTARFQNRSQPSKPSPEQSRELHIKMLMNARAQREEKLEERRQYLKVHGHRSSSKEGMPLSVLELMNQGH